MESHFFLASEIKNVHFKLRQKTKNIGAELAWKEHLKDDESLQKYARTMKKLACSFWEKNSKDVNKEAQSRIEWIEKYCKEYFFNDKLINFHRQKELQIYKDNKLGELINSNFLISNKQKISLLDVGSCYNPFLNIDIFEETAIDIAPNENVYKCDFLNVSLGKTIEYSNDKKAITTLPNLHFDVAVFSLLLEYLSTSDQRILLCKNAYNILKFEGILIIITPDSKHVGMNAKLMKTWRYTLSIMGFSRIQFEKLSHITCMVFRKSLYREVPERWAELFKEPYMNYSINIPQDFNMISIEDTIDVNKTINDEDEVKSMYSELPIYIDE